MEIENEEDFRKKVIEAQIPVLVDFYATYVNTGYYRILVILRCMRAHACTKTFSAVGAGHVAPCPLCWRM